MMKHLYLERCFMPFLRYSSWKCIIKLGATIPLVNTVFPYSLLPLLHCDPVFFLTRNNPGSVLGSQPFPTAETIFRPGIFAVV